MAAADDGNPGIGVAFRYLVEQHLQQPGAISPIAVSQQFRKSTASREWGAIGEQFASLLNNPPHHDDMEPIHRLVGAMGFDAAQARLANATEHQSSHEVMKAADALERARQDAYLPVASLIDSSEHATLKDSAQFRTDAYRVATMIHAMHVDAQYANRMDASAAERLSAAEMRHYSSSVPIASPSQMVGIKWGKAWQSTRRGARKLMGGGKEKLSKTFGSSQSKPAQRVHLLTNDRILTDKMYLNPGQLRRIVSVASDSDPSSGARYTSDRSMTDFGVQEYGFFPDSLTFLPRTVGPYSLNVEFHTGKKLLGAATTHPIYAELGYFESALSEYPFGQACIWSFADDIASDGSTLMMTLEDGAPLDIEVKVKDAFNHWVYQFRAATANFNSSRRISESIHVGDELWTPQQIDYQKKAASRSLPSKDTPIRTQWKTPSSIAGALYAFRLDQTNVKSTSSVRGIGEAGDYKTVAARCLIFAKLLDPKVRVSGSARRSARKFELTHAMLMIPTLQQFNHKALVIRRNK